MVLNKGSTLPTTISDYLRFPQSQQQSTTTTTDYIKLDELVAHRNSLYQKKKEEKKRAAGVKLLSGQLAWGYFSNDKLSAGEQKQNRATYNKFLDIIMKFVDNDEIPSDELHAASYEVFMMLGNPDKDDVFKQQSLKQLFGSGFKLNLYAALKQHVDQLLTVKNPYQANSAGAREASAIINDTDSQEWGNSFIKLNSVDELFIDIPYQNQEELDMQQEAASASMSSKKEEEIFIVKKTSKKQPQQRQPQQQPQQQQSQKSKFNDQWLIEKCLDVSKTSGLPSDQVMQSIVQTLKASKNIEEDLINILGFDHLDFVGDLVTNKSSVLHAIQNPTTTVKQQVTGKEKQSSNSKKGGQQNNKNDLYDAEEFEQFIPNPKQNIPANLQPQTEFKGKDLNVDAAMFSKVALPSNLIKKECGTHTEMTIPHSKPKPFAENEKLIPITDIDKRSRAAFGKIQSLNRIQSRVFDVAYKTNENLLICAPTGAGKTNIALLTILHEIENNFYNGILNLDQFKIIYIAPLKALAAEMTEKFGKSLAYLGIVVKELTGDMQLTQKELQETQIIITTPEKWDVVTRKSSDVALTQLVRLLIIDEIHLLHEERGPVLESVVARTLRQVETTQVMIRIVGLSATLPNYNHVAQFIHATPTSTFCFDASYRPVPMTSTFCGVKAEGVLARNNDMNRICYDKLEKSIKEGYQVMVFVHARRDTVKTAEAMVAHATEKRFKFADYGSEPDKYKAAQKDVDKAKAKEIRDLFQHGVSIHHAGLLRHDRNIVERHFADGTIKVLVCTATLAWGVNLPAHTVIIKGTQLYDSKNGGFIDLGISDVMQIFGRAGRPQFDTFGESFLLTTHDKLHHYLMLMSAAMPIESRFITNLVDHLNAEIVLGTVSNVREAVTWLGYTYLYIRMIANPHVYGIPLNEVGHDPTLEQFRHKLIENAAVQLEKSKMIRFDRASGNFFTTDLGRIASHYYIKHPSIETFNEILKEHMNQEQILTLLTNSSEFENVNLREEETRELTQLSENACFYETDIIDRYSKVKVMIQAYLSRAKIEGFSLVSDSNYVIQNSARILRGLFEITMKRGWCSVAKQILDLCKMIDHQMWHFEQPLRQFSTLNLLTLKKLEEAELITPDQVVEMDAGELATVVGNRDIATATIRIAEQFPKLEFDIELQPITSTILRINLSVQPRFRWNEKIHGESQPFWIWVEDSDNEFIYHSEYFILSKRQFNALRHQNRQNEEGDHQEHESDIKLSFIIPIQNPLPSQFFLHYISDRWLNCDERIPISFKHLIIPQQSRVINTELLDLRPLPKEALKNPQLEALFKFSHFNPIQTQVFHTLYYTNNNVLLGSPTGSGKTICAELAMFKVFRDEPHMKIVYIAPLKALVRERMNDWSDKLEKKLGKKLVELTGDYTPNVIALQNADVVTTTPEKWDGISRNWKNRSYVTSVSLLIIDEIHLLGELRGPTLEVIVSRMAMISKQTGHQVRIIGLSTAMANAIDLAEWMGIEKVGLFNFRPSCRPVPIEVHVQGFAGKHYCPRMQTMNKPTFASIKTYSPLKPVLVFVSSRRQTRLTAMDLISHLVVEDPTQWLHLGPADDLDAILDSVKDSHLRHTLSFGIGMHHAGLNDQDRVLVERLFADNIIQVLISTSTLAWGVNLPAHLVVIKGTEYFDGRTKTYVDYPLTDVLQMMGRAGRPQFDKEGKAVILVQESKKNFYKKFLYDPFPVESHLKEFLHDHLNAEIVSGTINNKQQAIEYLTNTFLFRRLLQSPTYYGCEDNSVRSINRFLSELLDNTLDDLQIAKCVSIDENTDDIEPLILGRIASFYYLNFRTVRLFSNNIRADNDIRSLLRILSLAHEYSEFPVRHAEDIINEEFNQRLPIKVEDYLSEHTKVHLLMQAHFERCALPIPDYVTDTKTALDQGIRILQAMIDVAYECGFFATVVQTIRLLQMLVQGRWEQTTDGKDTSLATLPHISLEAADQIAAQLGCKNLKELVLAFNVKPNNNNSKDNKNNKDIVERFKLLIEHQLSMPPTHCRETINVIQHLPIIKISEINQSDALVSRSKPHTVKILVQRENKGFHNNFCHAPQYPKNKDEGWIVVLTDENENFVAFKRLQGLKQHGNQKNNSSLVSFNINIPDNVDANTLVYHVKCYSDSYMGLDYFHTFTVKLEPKKK